MLGLISRLKNLRPVFFFACWEGEGRLGCEIALRDSRRVMRNENRKWATCVTAGNGALKASQLLELVLLYC